MARLPVVGSDTSTWGTVLNEYLGVAHNADGTHTDTGLGGARLGASASEAATSITLDRSAPVAFSVGQYIIIDPYTVEAEIRRVTSVSSATVTFGGGNPGLVYAHSAGDVVFAFSGGTVPWSMWGAVPGSTAAASTNVTAFNRLTVQIYNLGSYYAGGIFIPPGIWYIDGELHPERDQVIEGVHIMTSQIKAHTTFAFDGTDNVAMIRPQRDGVLLSTSNLASGRWIFRNLYLDGSQIANANGIFSSPQQPDSTENLRIDNCPGYAMFLVDVQQHMIRNFEGINNGVTLKLWAVRFLYVDGFNSEQADVHDIESISVSGDGNASRENHFVNVHLESGGAKTVAIQLDSSNATSPLNHGWVFDHVHYSTPDSPNTLFKFIDTGGRKFQYTLHTVIANGNTPLATMIDDGPRAKTYNAFYDFANVIDNFTTANDLAASASYPHGVHGARYLGSSGQEARVGAPKATGALPTASFYANQVSANEHHVRLFQAGALVFGVNGVGGTLIGEGSTSIRNVYVGSTTWDPGSLVDGAIETKDVTVTGAVTNMPCFATLTTITSAGWLVSATCTATDTITVVLMNKTGGTVNLGNGTVRACQVRF